MPINPSDDDGGVPSLLVLLMCIYLAYQIKMYVVFRNIVGLLYPAFCSYKAVQHKDRKQYVRWMMYWIVLAAFTLFEIVADITIGYVIPFYSIMKLLFIVWLSSSVTRGASIVFRHLVYPRLVQHEMNIDYAIGNLDEHLIYISKWLVHLFGLIRDTFDMSLTTAAEIDNNEDHVDGPEWLDDELINLPQDAVDPHTNDSMDDNSSDEEWVDDEEVSNKSHDVTQTGEEDDDEITDLSNDFFDEFEDALKDDVFSQVIRRRLNADDAISTTQQ